MGRAESFVEDYLRDRVKSLGGEIRKCRWIGRRGAADNLVWFPLRQGQTLPRYAWVECKASGKAVDWRSLQGREILRMRAAGFVVYVVASREEVDEMLDEVAL